MQCSEKNIINEHFVDINIIYLFFFFGVYQVGNYIRKASKPNFQRSREVLEDERD